MSTWPFLEAVRAAWRSVDSGLPAVDAVVQGCSACEQLRCDGTGSGLLTLDTSFLVFQFFTLVFNALASC